MSEGVKLALVLEFSKQNRYKAFHQENFLGSLVMEIKYVLSGEMSTCSEFFKSQHLSYLLSSPNLFNYFLGEW